MPSPSFPIITLARKILSGEPRIPRDDQHGPYRTAACWGAGSSPIFRRSCVFLYGVQASLGFPPRSQGLASASCEASVHLSLWCAPPHKGIPTNRSATSCSPLAIFCFNTSSYLYYFLWVTHYRSLSDLLIIYPLETTTGPVASQQWLHRVGRNLMPFPAYLHMLTLVATLQSRSAHR